MTLAEIKRAIESKQRVKKVEAQEKAAFDYILANLIGTNVAHAIVGGNDTLPKLEEVYTFLFKDEAEIEREKKAEKIAQLSALRFKQFANFHNSKFKRE